MINVTTLNNSYKFLGINYNKNTCKHTIIFESDNGDAYIDIDRDNAFGEFMVAVVNSYSEGLQHFVDELKKETTQ
jgi:hypothetical protein